MFRIFLSRSLLNPLTYNQSFDIGGLIFLLIKRCFWICKKAKNLKAMDIYSASYDQNSLRIGFTCINIVQASERF
jgi:hypothetical protein